MNNATTTETSETEIIENSTQLSTLEANFSQTQEVHCGDKIRQYFGKYLKCINYTSFTKSTTYGK